MAYSDDRSSSEETLASEFPAPERSVDTRILPYLPERAMTADHVHRVVRGGDASERTQLIAQLLSYAPWDEIWSFVDRADVRAVFDQLDLPPSLRQAWARSLDIETAGTDA